MEWGAGAGAGRMDVALARRTEKGGFLAVVWADWGDSLVVLRVSGFVFVWRVWYAVEAGD